MNHLNDKKIQKISLNKLSQLLKKQGQSQFNYDVFKLAYDSDPKLQELVKNFDQEEITLKSLAKDDLPAAQGGEGDSDTVNQMAKRATDLGKSI